MIRILGTYDYLYIYLENMVQNPSKWVRKKHNAISPRFCVMNCYQERTKYLFASNDPGIRGVWWRAGIHPAGVRRPQWAGPRLINKGIRWAGCQVTRVKNRRNGVLPQDRGHFTAIWELGAGRLTWRESEQGWNGCVISTPDKQRKWELS